jgi:hypothetical protein
VTHARRCALQVLKVNPARSLYERLGFLIDAERLGFRVYDQNVSLRRITGALGYR